MTDPPILKVTGETKALAVWALPKKSPVRVKLLNLASPKVASLLYVLYIVKT
jgi:hypothetical protein